MSRITGNGAKGLMEAYAAVYAPQEELEIEILEEIADALISQGHTAIDVLEYFANVDDEVIVEDLVALSEGTLIIESVVSEEYIEEQMQQLDEILGAALRLGGAALRAAKFAPKGANLGQRAMSALGGAGRAAQRISQQGTRASAVVRPALGNAVQAVRGAASGVTSKLGSAVSKVKDVARGALNKLPGGSGGGLARTLKGGAKLALGGAAFEAGMRGLGALMDRGKAPAAKTTPTSPADNKAKFNASAALGGKTAFQAGGGAAALKAAQKQDPKLTAADIQRRGTAALRSSAGGDLKKGAELFKAKQQIMAGKPTSTPAAPAKPAPAAAAPEVRATNTLAARPTQPSVAPGKPKTETKPTPKPAGGQSTMSQDAAELRDMQRASQLRQQGQDVTGANLTSVRKDIEKFNKPEELNKPAPAGTALAAEQERRRKAQQVQQAQQAKPVEESYDAYDLVLEYLFDTEQAETVKEAHYLMTEMDSEMIQSIVEAKRKSYSAKKARRGEDLGLPGKGFGKIAKEAGERYGSEERGEKVAGAVLKGLRAKHGK